ncbi:ABC transporter ATP-binding protein [Anaerocolumna sp. AGMB13025]|uniref:ABC transporter ATP-binding protein n=1 Tax=Anaerocolumna sp. AGMB13025 TaxID=3039116 RepID=UPI00241E635B|nr:ABC transporter ATP-binding protein [Anaerocolumna sp. AGMB13025]WFR55645.1 ABC transporter ATP-binding protein [Anaerocolumna sp. AGMB13025]
MKSNKKLIEIISSIKDLLSARKKDFVFLGIGKTLIILFSLAEPVFKKYLIDDVILNRKLEVLWFICIGMVIVYLLDTLTQIAIKKKENSFYYKITYQVIAKLWNYITRQKTEYYEENDIGELKNRVDNDVIVFEDFIKQQIVGRLVEMGTIAVIVIILTFMNWILTLFGILILPLVFKITVIMGNKVGAATEEYRQAWSGYEKWLVNDLRGWKEVRALNIQKNDQIYFVKHWKTLCKSNFTKWMYWFGNECFIAFKDTFLVNLSIYFVGAIFIFKGFMTVGELLVFKVYYEQLMVSINRLNNYNMIFSRDYPLLKRVVDMLHCAHIKKEKKEPLLCSDYNISFQNMSFRYKNQENNALSNINLEIKGGERLAVIGKSGCGKSTLVKLLSCLYYPSEGRLCIDGQETELVNEKEIHDLIGVVMQDNTIFNLSILDNLKLAKPEADMEEIEQACEYAGFKEVVDQMEQGFNMVVGEKGSILSGGQRQRLNIARIMLKNPKIIIFDEATSALDYQSEQIINETIERISKGRTIIVIAHRLSSILKLDRGIVLKDGRIVGDDTLEALWGNNEEYRDIFQSQYEN